jgi:hypothetical protein
MVSFDELVTVIRKLHGRSTTVAPVTGSLLIDSQETNDLLQRCCADDNNIDMTLIGRANVGETVQVEIGTPRVPFGLVLPTMSDLLHAPRACIAMPDNFYLLDQNYKSGENPTNPLLTAYNAVLKLVEVFRQCAAFLDEHECTLVLIRNGKFEIPVTYDTNSLDKINVQSLENLSHAIPEGAHEKQCRSIMAESISALTAGLALEQRFPMLLERSDELLKAYNTSYELFAAGFTYEKIKGEIEAAGVEFSGRIHKVFTDIQNQVLGIPVATVVVATQMKSTTAVDGQYWTNLAIVFGSLMFAILVVLLIRNQLQTLDVVGLEINRQKSKLQKEHAAIAPNFIETFRLLDKRSKTQHRALVIVDLLVVLGLVLSLVWFFLLTLPANSWLVAHFTTSL